MCGGGRRRQSPKPANHAAKGLYRIVAKGLDRIAAKGLDRIAAQGLNRIAAKGLDRIATKGLDRIAAKALNRIAAKALDRIAADGGGNDLSGERSPDRLGVARGERGTGSTGRYGSLPTRPPMPAPTLALRKNSWEGFRASGFLGWAQRVEESRGGWKNLEVDGRI